MNKHTVVIKKAEDTGEYFFIVMRYPIGVYYHGGYSTEEIAKKEADKLISKWEEL